MPNKTLVRVRCAPAYAPVDAIRNINVDRNELVIRNAVAMLANVEAIGHGLMSDITTLQQTAALGNARQNGTQGRLGHPGLSENATARQLFNAQNFRIADDKLLVDLHLFEPARRSPAFGNDPVEWMLDMAEQYPEQIALSAVIGVRAIWLLESGEEIDADPQTGLLEKPETATTDLPIMRVESLWAVDVVNEGALTRSMFSPNEAAFYAEGVFDFLDEWRAQFNIPLADVPRKATQLVSKYLYSRGYQGSIEPMTVTGKGQSTKGAAKRRLEEQSGVPAAIIEDDLPGMAETGDDEPTAPVAPLPAAESDPLAEAETEAAETSERLNTPPAEPEEPTREDLMARIAQLEATVERLVKLTVQNTKNITTLSDDVRRIDGEPFVKASVPKTQALGAALPGTPDATTLRAALNAKPTHISERRVSGTPIPTGTPEGDALASLAASNKRTRAQQ